MDGTTRLSRNGEQVYHYSFLSTFAEACVVPERSCIQIPRRRPVRDRGARRLRDHDGRRRGLAHGPVRVGDRVAVIGCGGVGLSALMAAVAAGAEPVIAVDAAPQKLEVARSFGASEAILWQGTPEATAEALHHASGGGVDVAIEATGRPEAMLAAYLGPDREGRPS